MKSWELVRFHFEEGCCWVFLFVLTFVGFVGFVDVLIFVFFCALT
jgi:hypothetical protein